MQAFLDTAGERLAIESAVPWVSDLIAEGSAGALRRSLEGNPSVRVRVEAERSPFPDEGWELLARGARTRGGEVTVENACTAGFDLHLKCSPEHAEFTFRWRPPVRDRAAARVLHSRFHLLARAVLIQFPALWWAGTRRRVPLHAGGCIAAGSTCLVTAPSGVGRSTLLLAELDAGSAVTGDNLSVGDGTTVWGLVEPLRVEGAGGRRMPHGREEMPLRGRVAEVVPDCLVVLEQGGGDHATLMTCSPVGAARSLVTSTYMAGELRRYWALAATLAAGTGVGPAHPPVTDIAASFSAKLPCFSLSLDGTRGAQLSELLSSLEMEALT